MPSLYSIWTVARIEAKTLFRSWFFRILAGLVLGLLIIMGVVMYTTTGPSLWAFRAISSAIPYAYMLYMNIAQAVLAVFLASDFLKRDRKLDTTEVVYMRSMTNWEYVAGKTVGILFVFLLLNLAVLIAAAVFNIFFAGVPFMPVAYLAYPLIISLPTLVFILGLSFLLMVLIRNQAVTFIIILGYIGVTLFYLGGKLHHLPDYTAWRLPLLYSDFTGFANLNRILVHRAIYLLLGLGFIFLTVVMIKRLPQSRLMNNVSRVMAVAALAGGVVLGVVYIGEVKAERELRKEILALNDKWIDAPEFTIRSCDIALRHLGEQIEARAGMTVENESGGGIEELVFSLNPGLRVTGVTSSGEELEFERELQILRVRIPRPLKEGGSCHLAVSYHGSIDDAACYPDVTEEERESNYRLFIYNIPRKHSVISPGCLLLTPENLWYPAAGARFDPPHWEVYEKYFTRYTLRVETGEGITPVSQGKSEKKGDGSFVFTPEVPLPCLSLAAADYQRRSVTVDSVEYNLYTKEGHDYFAPYFDQVGDTLSAVIREIKRDYENDLELEYPYRRLNLVEVPVNLPFYQRVWTLSNEFIQPQTVMLPEMGVIFRWADFREWMEGRRGRRLRERHGTDQALQAWMLEFFVTRTVTGGLRNEYWGMGGNSVRGISFDVFPNYYTFIHYIRSDNWPVLNLAMESYLAGRMEEGSSPFFRYVHGLTAEEEANIALKENSMREIIAGEEDRGLVANVLKIKGEYLFSMMETEMGKDEFSSFMGELFEYNMFGQIEEEEFISGLEGLTGERPGEMLDNWYRSSKLPGFVINDFEAYQILEGDRTRNQVRFRVSNRDSVDGLVRVTYRSKGGGRRFRRGPPGRGGPEGSDVERLVTVRGGETREIGAVLDYQPREVLINTMVSRNLPATIEREFQQEFELNENAFVFDGVRTVGEDIVLEGKDELIVDNEDPGFETIKRESASLLKRILGRDKEREDEYVGVRMWEDWLGWRITVNSSFYGECVKSAHFTKAGGGEEKAVWEAKIPESGYYEVYVYITRMSSPWRRRREEDHERGSYTYYIHHDDGVEKVEKELIKSEVGWNFLGSYYFSEGTAEVELTNQSEARLVVADAVKWVKR